ncbi:MAG: plasmid stabilization protein [Deltaproteobacteria bacterium]|nr:plasmid stabilization protein [Deltaproteobacteria bacterium]
MAILNIRNFDDESHQRLRMRAARNRRSMEAEARQILEDAMAAEAASAVAAASDLQRFVADLYDDARPEGVTDDFLAERRREAQRELGESGATEPGPPDAGGAR